MDATNKTVQADIDEDYLNFKSEKSVKKAIGDETLLFSMKVTKINKYDMWQDRFLVITTKALYNFKKTSLRRRIDVNVIMGISVSKLTDEFVIHCLDIDHDYNYVSPSRKRIIEIINGVFRNCTQRELYIAEYELKTLKEKVTLKKEKKANPSFSRMESSKMISFTQFNLGLKTENVLRKKISTVVYTIEPVNSYKDVSLEDFKVLNIIGRGSFGNVLFVEYLPTKENFAMKVVKKELLLEQDLIEKTILEKKILQSIQHPFLINMFFCFQNEDSIFLVMPFMVGGELFQHLQALKTFDEDRVRFYGAQIAMGLDKLHSFGFIYRDLKPENILMDEDGYLKITDFGTAKHLKGNEKARTFCGTPEYLAPEIIIGEGHNESADWWSFGILMYEMLCGIPPYYNDNIERMYELIKYSELKFPKKVNLTDNAKDLIIKLLNRSPDKRLGALKGIEEIKAHPFFTGFNFELVRTKKLNAPFIPKTDGNRLKYFPESVVKENIDSIIIANPKVSEEVKENNFKFDAFR